MTSQSLAKALTAASLLLAALSAVRWRQVVPDEVADANGAVSARAVARTSVEGAGAVNEAADITIENDPFRLTNSPASVRFDLASDGITPGVVAPVVRPLRPLLVLKAIVGGPPWQAVIDGIPGEPPGAIAESGKRFDKLLVRSVTRDSVIVQGPDTSWVLSFRRGS